jgi:hypothetical protein
MLDAASAAEKSTVSKEEEIEREVSSTAPLPPAAGALSIDPPAGAPDKGADEGDPPSCPSLFFSGQALRRTVRNQACANLRD